MGILAAVAGTFLIMPSTQRRSTDYLGASPSIAYSTNSTVHAQPTPNWKLNSQILASRSSLKKIQMLDATKGWMAAYPMGVYRTSDAAETWQQVSLKLPERAYVTDIFFVSPDAGWVAASKTGLDFEESKDTGSYDDATWIMETSDAGKSWRKNLTLEKAQITQIRFVGNSEGWAAGRRFSNGGSARDTNLVLHTNDGGRNWIDVSGNLPPSDTGVDQLFGIDQGRISLLTLNGFIYSTIDGGQNWHQVDAFRDQREQTAIHRAGVTQNESLWLLGGTSSQEGTSSIFAIKEGGGNWARREIAAIDLADALFLSEDRIIACGSMSSGKEREAVILYSIDRGANWVIAHRNRESTALNSLATIDSKRLLSAGEGGLVLHIELP